MRNTLISVCSILLLSACNFVQSDSADTASDVDNKQVSSQALKTSNITSSDLKGTEFIKSKLEASGQLKVSSVKKSSVDDIYEVQLEAGKIIYTNDKASHFFVGDLYSVDNVTNALTNVTDVTRAALRVQIISEIPKKDTITFKAKGKTKGHIYVFTDVDCYYCQKLHKEVPALNAAGVEVRYLAFPRSGLDTDTYKKIQSAWCAKDKQEALTRLKNRESIEMNVCDDDAVKKQYATGIDIGVTGTPAIITSNGELISGYMFAQALLNRIGIK